MEKDETKICGAKTRNGGQCRKPPLRGSSNGRCKLHNGNAKRGKEHPRYKHGRFVRYELLGDMRETLSAISEDEDLKDLHDDLVLWDVKTRLAVKMIDDSYVRGLFQQQQKLLREMNREPIAEKRAMLLSDILALIQVGATEEAKWDEVARSMNQKHKTIMLQHKREIDIGVLVHQKEVLTFITQLMEFIQAKIKDDPTRKDLITYLEAVYRGDSATMSAVIGRA